MIVWVYIFFHNKCLPFAKKNIYIYTQDAQYCNVFLQKSKEFNMNVLKKLSFLMLIGIGVICASIENEVRDNEETINLLQKQIDNLQAKGEQSDDLQKIMDKLIQKQNALLAKKAAESTEKDNEIVSEQPQLAQVNEGTVVKEDNETAKIRRIVREVVKEELAKQIHPKNNHNSEAKLEATKKAELTAPDLPERNSEAIAQYELALEQYNKSEYKLASSGFGRIIKAYPKDPITAKALVHLAYCLEKQNDLDKAVVVSEEALKRKLDVVHQADCQLIRLHHAKTQKNDKDMTEITKILKDLKLTEEQKKTFAALSAKK